jgi:hypothetical protein
MSWSRKSENGWKENPPGTPFGGQFGVVNVCGV